MSGSKFVYVIYIRITLDKLWRALTTREIIKQYRFGMIVESEWKVGPRGECMLMEARWTRARFSRVCHSSGW